jgi:hypothetical protein
MRKRAHRKSKATYDESTPTAHTKKYIEEKKPIRRKKNCNIFKYIFQCI